MSKFVVVPVVNLNGTHVDDLIEQTQMAAFAIRTAINALQLAAPHGRDYQTLESAEGTYCAAREQHVGWVNQLEDIYQALEERGHRIWAQKEERELRKAK
jgi:hypothetical protein